jgi:formylmethanofuran dehydrogenase subunit A
MPLITEFANCRVIDPTQQEPSAGNGLRSVWVEGKQIVPPPTNGRADQTVDLRGAIVMAGGIDLHTHIGGGKVNLARMLMAGQPLRDLRSLPSVTEPAGCVWPTTLNGQLYAQMGYTACFEPAMMLSQARHTHLELADTPVLDTGAYVVLGNEDWLLQALGNGLEDQSLRCLVAWSIRASQALAVKVVNPGGINAFKFNERALAVDQPHPHYGVTPRDVIRRMTGAVDDLGLAHPLHVHASNLGVPGNVASTLATLEAAEGRRIHLTHAQFNCYSGPFSDADVGYAMGSGAEILSRYANEHTNVTLDVGQVVFGQTVTISADEAAQFRNRVHARPRQWIISDVECQAGCGVVPMLYSDKNYVHSLQWTIGLELLLLINDPWRVFLTTDHPNGGPFTSYPHLIRLLMDRTFRQSMLETIHPQAAARSLLRELDREYTLEEIAIITRAAPARILGLHDCGSLRPGMRADLVAYAHQSDWEATFKRAALVLKNGREVVRDGQLTHTAVEKRTFTASPEFAASDFGPWSASIEKWLHLPSRSLVISNDELHEIRNRRSEV